MTDNQADAARAVVSAAFQVRDAEKPQTYDVFNDVWAAAEALLMTISKLDETTEQLLKPALAGLGEAYDHVTRAGELGEMFDEDDDED